MTKADSAVDVFSLGVILGEMLSGECFPAGITSEEVGRKLQRTYPYRREELTGLSESIANFLASDPEKRLSRYQTGVDVLRQLFREMTRFDFEPPCIVISKPNLRWLGQVAFSSARLGEHERAIEGFEQIARLTKREESKGPHKGAVVFDWDRQEFIFSKEAIKSLEEEYAEDPTDLERVLMLARTHLLAGEYDRSRTLFEEARELDDRREEAISGLMDVARKTGNHEELLRLGRILSELPPLSSGRLAELGKIYGELGRIEEGLAAFERAEEIEELVVDHLVAYGDLLSRAGDVAGAEKVFGRAIKLEPAHGLAWYNLGVCQRKLGKRTACLKSFEKALESDGPEGACHNHIASLAMETGDVKTALDHLQKASVAQPENPKIWFNMGSCMLFQGEFQEAVRYLEVALEIDPDYELAKRVLKEVRGGLKE